MLVPSSISFLNDGQRHPFPSPRHRSLVLFSLPPFSLFFSTFPPLTSLLISNLTLLVILAALLALLLLSSLALSFLNHLTTPDLGPSDRSSPPVKLWFCLPGGPNPVKPTLRPWWRRYFGRGIAALSWSLYPIDTPGWSPSASTALQPLESLPRKRPANLDDHPGWFGDLCLAPLSSHNQEASLASSSSESPAQATAQHGTHILHPGASQGASICIYLGSHTGSRTTASWTCASAGRI